MFSASALNIVPKLLSFAVFASLVSIDLPVKAAVEHIVYNIILMGANNVEVGDALKNVQFVDGNID